MKISSKILKFAFILIGLLISICLIELFVKNRSEIKSPPLQPFVDLLREDSITGIAFLVSRYFLICTFIFSTLFFVIPLNWIEKTSWIFKLLIVFSITGLMMYAGTKLIFHSIGGEGRLNSLENVIAFILLISSLITSRYLILRMKK